MSVNYGSKRIVTGAGYGFRDWLAQRVTGALMALFTVILLAQVIFTSGPIGYEQWAGIFAGQLMKFLTFAVIVALLYHVWVGMRDIWMDYVKPVAVRLVALPLMIFWARYSTAERITALYVDIAAKGMTPPDNAPASQVKGEAWRTFVATLRNRNIALTAEKNGFDNILLPSGYQLGIDNTVFAAGIAVVVSVSKIDEGCAVTLESFCKSLAKLRPVILRIQRHNQAGVCRPGVQCAAILGWQWLSL